MTADSPEDREPTAPNHPRGGAERWELGLYGALLAYFAARVLFLALRLDPFVPPDETTHVGRILAYAGTWGVPPSSPATLQLGLIDHRPWLYYWVMARVASLDVLPGSTLVFLRLVNGLLGVATVVVAIGWIRTWCGHPIARILFVVFLTNTLMFTGLSGAVSYDNGVNLLAAGAIAAYTAFRSGRSPEALLAFVAVLLAGCLAKRSFLPLAFLLTALLLFRERRALRALPRRALALARAPRPAVAALAVVVLALGGLVGALYGGNLLRYGALVPGFEQVVGEDDAGRYRVHARNRILERFRTGEIRYEEAAELAGRIEHAGDRRGTLYLLKIAQRPASEQLGRLRYAFEWPQRMLTSALSYVGHRHARKPRALMLGYFAIFALAAVLGVRSWRPGDAGGIPADAAFLTFGYAAILMWLVHYPTYVTTRSIELALQGRYLFPVLLPMYGLLAYFLIEPLPARARPWVATAAAGIYLYGDVPWLMGQLSRGWLMAAS